MKSLELLPDFVITFVVNYIVLLEFILGLTDISAQLSLALAMDRCDITRSTIFIDSRRKELHVSTFHLESFYV